MRLFVAVNFPSTLRQAIWDAVQPIREAGYPVRWVAVDQIHLTLKFLGEVPPERIDAVTRCVREVAAGSRRFGLPLAGAGAFPNAARPRVVWIGCEGVPPLELLQHSLERGMDRLGFPMEGRPFRPHVTLGRVRREARPGAFRDLHRELARVDFEGVTEVTSVDLMESRLGGTPPRYRRHAHGVLAD